MPRATSVSPLLPSVTSPSARHKCDAAAQHNVLQLRALCCNRVQPVHDCVADGGTLLRCLCAGGFTCAYTKRIVATITLGNTTVAGFNADAGGVRTALVRAVALAAGVPEARVAIQSVVASVARQQPQQPPQGRRLLLLDASAAAAAEIKVTAFVHGAERLHALEAHLAQNGHAHRHRSHAWREAHSLAVVRAPI